MFPRINDCLQVAEAFPGVVGAFGAAISYHSVKVVTGVDGSVVRRDLVHAFIVSRLRGFA